MQDLYNVLKVVKAVNPASITATANGLTVDTAGYHQLMFVLDIGAISAADGSNYLTFTVEESDTDFSGTAVTDTNRILGSLPVINVSTQANTIIKFGIAQLTKRYIRVVYTETGTFSAIFGVQAILGQPMEVTGSLI